MNNHYHDSPLSGILLALILVFVLYGMSVLSIQEKVDQTAVAIAVEDTKQAEAAQAEAMADAVPAVAEQVEDMMTISYFFTIVVGAGVIILLLLAYMGGFIRPAPRIVKTDEYGRPYGPWRE